MCPNLPFDSALAASFPIQNFAEFVKNVMAENLPFSIANILRSDFPHSSRISKVPSIEHLTPSRERKKALLFTMRWRPVQVFPHCSYNEGRASGGKSLHTLRSPQTVEKDVFQNLGDVQGQKQNDLTGRIKEGNFWYLYLYACTEFILAFCCQITIFAHVSTFNLTCIK